MKEYKAISFRYMIGDFISGRLKKLMVSGKRYVPRPGLKIIFDLSVRQMTSNMQLLTSAMSDVRRSISHLLDIINVIKIIFFWSCWIKHLLWGLLVGKKRLFKIGTKFVKAPKLSKHKFGYNLILKYSPPPNYKTLSSRYRAIRAS